MNLPRRRFIHLAVGAPPHSRPWRALVLGMTAVVALGFLMSVLAIAVIANGVERARMLPAE
jgi:hypothetical protein